MTSKILANPPSLIAHGNLRFLVMDAPSESNLHLYIQELEKYGVHNVVRVCEPTYSAAELTKKNITVHDWSFSDGEAPPANIVNDWLNLVDKTFPHDKKSTSEPSNTIAIHCVAGLGRAPVLVAIALIESGMSALDAVFFIRERRRGAINNRQLKYLENYKRKRSKGACIIC